MRNWGAVGQGDANVPQLAAIADGRFAIYYPNGDSAISRMKRMAGS